MNTVVLAGNQANQKALCHKIAETCNLSAIVVSENVPRKKPDFGAKSRSFVNRISNRIFGRPFVQTWFEMLAVYESRFPTFPDVPLIKVRNVNDAETLEVLEHYGPRITIVSGTNLVGKRLINLADNGEGIVNLHTGISPYVKGGPNCTNWCLAKNWFHLIGNTIMWLDAGIDTGKIIATERTPLSGTETLLDLHLAVMEHGHELYIRAIRRILGGYRVPSVPQDSIDAGTLFYNKDWNIAAMRDAVRNFRDNYKNFFQDKGKQQLFLDDLKFVNLI
jgi:folate-dependent phosphoribosylglycinamide formyltransferase PurN